MINALNQNVWVLKYIWMLLKYIWMLLKYIWMLLKYMWMLLKYIWMLLKYMWMFLKYIWMLLKYMYLHFDKSTWQRGLRLRSPSNPRPVGSRGTRGRPPPWPQ